MNTERPPVILIADDEPEFRDPMRTVLEQQSYRVVTAGQGTDAQSAVRAEKPDLIILGTLTPRGDAFRFYHWLRQTSGFMGMPLIIIDARPEEQLWRGWHENEGMQCEADDFLDKPVEPQALLPRIRKLLDTTTRRIRVLVADDHAIVRDGIRAVLSVQHDMQVVGSAVNGREALEKTIQLSPDVVLMDIVMPVMNGLDAAKQIFLKCPQVRVLMLTQYDDHENILASQQVGAVGFIPKSAVSSLLLTGIRSASEGKEFVCPPGQTWQGRTASRHD